jgi:hypothetical protein
MGGALHSEKPYDLQLNQHKNIAGTKKQGSKSRKTPLEPYLCPENNKNTLLRVVSLYRTLITNVVRVTGIEPA